MSGLKNFSALDRTNLTQIGAGSKIQRSYHVSANNNNIITEESQAFSRHDFSVTEEKRGSEPYASRMVDALRDDTRRLAGDMHTTPQHIAKRSVARDQLDNSKQGAAF